MSSHHIVREKQEPALLILNLSLFDEENLGQLLEWSPTILVNDESAEKLHSLGIKFDVLLTKSASGDLQDNLKTISVKDDALNAGLQFLINEKYPAVNIITDKNSIESLLPYAEQITLVIYHENKKIYPVSSGFQKWKPKGDLIEMIDPPQDLQQNGLELINQNQFKTLSDGFFTLKFSQPYLFISEEI